ncbi:putative glutamine amidotransferase-related [Cardiosporidium cionae]|uniref:Glutamine amidotransferase-related n=1 Tax=Cardiosporidium cionae TaxID=476202 RepID=A0ABQ7JC00_9APIC|nr:putative glutamine amidotransferase-related [Cardiosporidium cionae]|eukprot:KAF8821525.1 putative glutamine amidotransferase-related [Cardiosporidium cionae]
MMPSNDTDSSAIVVSTEGIGCHATNSANRECTFSENYRSSLSVRKSISNTQKVTKATNFGNPIILLVCRRHLRKNKYINYVGEYHLNLIQRFGGIPLMVPRTSHTRYCLEMYLPVDGFIIAEGEDLGVEYHPYGNDRALDETIKQELISLHPSDAIPDEIKDEIEWSLLDMCLQEGVPFLGLCRGCQILNVKCGGSLWYDISHQLKGSCQHINYKNYDTHRHPIIIFPETPLYDWFHQRFVHPNSQPNDSLSDALQEAEGEPGGDPPELEEFLIPGGEPLSGESKECAPVEKTNGLISVNSYHHQGIKVLAPPFTPMAISPDGLVEAFYDQANFDPKNGKFCMGLQFHPERMMDEYPGCVRVYEEFITACWAYRANRLRGG